MLTKFKVGTTYSRHSVGDDGCVWTYTVKSRTAQTIKTACGKSLRINKMLTAHNSAETVFPLGRHSMAPILTATDIA